MKLLDVSPLVHKVDLDLLKNVALREVRVVDRASLLAKPCINTAPVSTFWAIATANPFSSHFMRSNKLST